MKLLGFDTARLFKGREVVVREAVEKALQAVYGRPTFYGQVMEPFTGGWQQNTSFVTADQAASYYAVYSCVSLIARDISKMRVKLVSNDGGIWTETESIHFSPVLRKPNHFQTRIAFFQSWITSKLLNGNAYILKERDNGSRVKALYVLDPMRVTPLVSGQGEVFYQLKADYLSGLNENTVIVPAREIIHDTCITLFHPLVGVSPIYAAGTAASQGMSIQTNSNKFFANMSRPSGVLTAPGAIADETAARLKTAWDTNFSGTNIGKVAVLGDGLHYEAMTITPIDAQMIEQLKMSAEVVCATFHVPPYKIGLVQPTYANVEALNLEYYNQALQAPIESIELLLDEGLGLLPSGYGTEFDLDSLLRMDTATRYATYAQGIGSGWLAPNEVRKKENYEPAKGGDSPMMQQQQYSLEALAVRDADKPFAKPAPATPAITPPPENEAAKAIEYLRGKGLAA